MKRSMSFAALAAVTSLALAQSPSSPAPGGPRGGPPQIERLAQDLSLTPEQQTAIKAICDSEHAKREAERAQWEASGTRPTREQLHAQMEMKDAQLRAQLATVLTPEQLTKFDGMRKRQRRMGPPPGEAGRQQPQ